MIKKNILFVLLIAAVFVLAGCSYQDRYESEVINEDNNISSTNNINSNNTNNTNNNMENNNSLEQTATPIEDQADLLNKYSKAIVKTNRGNITLEFFGEDSPVTVNNFLNLAEEGFYNNTKFHRVIEGFMIQGGDPNSKTDNTNTYGTGDPGYKFADEINDNKLVAGSLAMANSGPNTNGSQFFIVTAEETPWLDGAHTNFGQVVSGMEVVREIEAAQTGNRDVPLNPIVINDIELVK